MNKTYEKSLGKEADVINELHSKITQCNCLSEDKGKEAVRLTIECGEHLIRIKQSLGKGGYLKWLQTYCKGFGKGTASNYIKLANGKHIASVQDSTSIRQAYIACGAITRPDKDVTVTFGQKKSNNPFTKAKGYTIKLCNLLNATDDESAMVKEIQPIIDWYEDYKKQSEKELIAA